MSRIALWKVRLSSFRNRDPRPGERQQLFGVVAERVGRDHVEQGLDRLAHAVEVVAVLLVGIGVVGRDASDLAQVLVVVLGEPQVLALGRGRELRRHEERQEAVLGQLQLVDDLGPEEGQGVREGREPETGTELLGDGRSADQVPLLQDQGLQPATGQVGAVDEPVVTAAHHDRVVAVGHPIVPREAPLLMAVFRSGLNRGSRATWAATF